MMTVTTLQAMQATTSLLAALLGGTALLYSMFSQTRALKISHYNELDKTYQTLLNIAMQNTYFIKPESIATPEQQAKYDLYAFMMWNFLEAIYDKCLKDRHLKETWVPIIEVEGKLHFSWFTQESNRDKFKPIFYHYVMALLMPSIPEPHDYYPTGQH